MVEKFGYLKGTAVHRGRAPLFGIVFCIYMLRVHEIQ